MNIYLFNREEFFKYYNCSALSDDQWRSHGVPSLTVGLINIISGIGFMTIYIPCLIVMLQPDLFKFSCFKIMFYLGVIDVVSLAANAVLTGVLSILGAMPCPHLELFYPVGCVGIGLWCAQCAACLLLALNRCVDIWKPRYLKNSFLGSRTYYWIALCGVYMLYVICFTRSAFFSSKTYAWYFNPYTGIDGLDGVDDDYYVNKTHFINNLVVIVVLPVLYIFMSISIYWKSNGHTSSNVTRLQVQVVIQSFFICLLNFTAASLYIYMQFFPTPMPIVVFTQFVWQVSNGGGALIYLIVNRTIRFKVKKLMQHGCGKRIDPSISSVNTNYSRPRTYEHSCSQA